MEAVPSCSNSVTQTLKVLFSYVQFLTSHLEPLIFANFGTKGGLILMACVLRLIGEARRFD